MAGLGQVVRAEMGGRRGVGVGAFVLAIVTAGALAHVGVRMKGIEVAYDLGREKRVNTQLEEERRRLNIEIGMLKDPVRVVSIARDKLNMGPPAQTDIVRLGPGQILGAGPARVDVPPKRERSSASTARARARAPRVVTPSGSAGEAEAPKSDATGAPASEATKDEAPVTAPAQEGDE